MNLKYWEWESAPLKDKLKNASVRALADVFFENETQAYRFARALLFVKKVGALKLRDCPDDLPLATWKRYLDYAVQVGLLKHEDQTYYLTNRFSTPLKNLGEYYAKWQKEGLDEDASLLYPLARKEPEKPRRGQARVLGSPPAP